MNDEESYEQGNRMAYRSMLQDCCRRLGVDDPEAAKARWIAEREEAITVLQDICAEYGDLDWNGSLHLADIIEKHLHRNLNANLKPTKATL